MHAYSAEKCTFDLPAKIHAKRKFHIFAKKVMYTGFLMRQTFRNQWYKLTISRSDSHVE